MKMSVWGRMARLLLVLSAVSAATGVAHAQMPPDQRRQMRQEMREQWRQMPQDDRQRMRDEMRGYGPPPAHGGGGGGRGQRGGWR